MAKEEQSNTVHESVLGVDVYAFNYNRDGIMSPEWTKLAIQIIETVHKDESLKEYGKITEICFGHGADTDIKFTSGKVGLFSADEFNPDDKDWLYIYNNIEDSHEDQEDWAMSGANYEKGRFLKLIKFKTEM